MKNEHKDYVEAVKHIFCERLKELRQERKYSQKAVAEKLKIAVSTYANWEQGRTEPSVYDIFNLLNVFDVEPNELLDFSELKRI